MRPKTRLALRAAGGIVAVLLGVFIVRSVKRDGPAALQAWRGAELQWQWLALSVACAVAGQLVYVLGWRRLLTDAGMMIPFVRLTRIFFVSNLGRYLPAGKAWQMGITGLMAAEEGLPGAALAASSLVQAVVGTTVGVLTVFAAGGSMLGLDPTWMLLPVAGVAGLLAAPSIGNRLPTIRAVVARRVPGVERITIGTMWCLIWTAALSWVLWGAGLMALARGLLPLVAASLSSFIAAWSASFLAGILAFFTPAGLGARESVTQGVLLQAGLDAGSALVVVVVSRVWATALDVLPAVAGLLLIRSRGGPVAGTTGQANGR